jgi:hypothetical protein
MNVSQSKNEFQDDKLSLKIVDNQVLSELTYQ